MNKFYVYVLKSRVDGKFYIGLTCDLKDRLKRHNQSRVASTRSRALFDLIYFENFASRVQTRQREKFFKSGNGRKFLENKFASVVELADTPA